MLTGKDAGKRGTVQRVVTNPQGWKKPTARFGAGWQRTSPLAGAAVVVEGINIAKRHTKPRASAGRTDRQPRVQQGGILDIAQPHRHQQRHGHLPALLATHARSATTQAADGRSVRACAHCGEPVTQRGEEAQVSGELRQRYHDEVVPALRKEFELRQRDAGAAPDQDRRQHRPGRGAARRQGASTPPSATSPSSPARSRW